MNFKKWIYSITLVLCFAVPNQAKKSVSWCEESKVQPEAGNVFEISIFKNLTPRIPTGKNLTNLKKSEFITYGYKVKPSVESLRICIEDIKFNGDPLGRKTEGIIDEIMISNGYNKMEGKYRGNKGFDGVYIKGTAKKPTEIVIIESKQFRYIKDEADVLVEHSGMTLNPPSPATGLPAQMSEDWINDVSQNLRNAGKLEISDMVDNYPNLIIKYVSAVDKVLGEINFLKLDKY
jgi:hypothetical protein